MAANPDENSKNSEQNQHEFIAPKPVSGDVLRAEEEKLKAKYQLPNNWKGSGHSAFLQKKLAKGKYFDSGDYQMAKQTSGIPKVDRAVPQSLLKFATGDAIPTPDTVPARKTSIIQPKFTPNTLHNLEKEGSFPSLWLRPVVGVQKLQGKCNPHKV